MHSRQLSHTKRLVGNACLRQITRGLVTARLSHRTAVMFPGQGAQHVGMGEDIYEKYAAAREVIDASDKAIKGGLKKLMFEGPQHDLTSTENAQPAILCHSAALLRVLEKEHGFNIRDYTFAMGHSLGEYTALVATGALSLEDAIQLVRLRGESMHRSVETENTSMKALVINGDHLEDIEQIMSKIKRSLPDGEVAQISNINSRGQVVLSGTAKGVDYACSIIQMKGYAGRALNLPVSAPFHCSLMQPAADEMKSALEATKFHDPKIEVISNVTGQPFESHKDIASLLYQQITKTVQWQRSIRFAKDEDVHDWIVIGPSRVLANLLKKECPTDTITAISTAEDIEKFGPKLQDMVKQR
ncbi:acyl transferase/acyl hydrolase/lysophospholipase [Phlyctochytrium arcticum]|nr:acyl transferase/acyl hydrolase/lysophospholipase [Phlyctochytrium arcticum]